MADSRPGWFRRIVFWSFVLLVAVMITSHSVSYTQEPPIKPLPPNGNAAEGADSAALLDPRDPKVIEAAALAAQQVLHHLEALTAREPKQTPPWAKGLGPGDPVAIHNFDLWTPDGSLNPVLGGVHPVQLRERVRELAFTGRISKAEYEQLRIKIKNIPLGLHVTPEGFSYP